MSEMQVGLNMDLPMLEPIMFFPLNTFPPMLYTLTHFKFLLLLNIISEIRLPYLTLLFWLPFE